MKNIYSFIVISIILLSCGGSNETPEQIIVNLNGTMVALTNGNAWTSGPKNSAKINFVERSIHIEGIDAEDGIQRSHITLIVDEVIKGTYDSKTSRATYYDVRTNSTYISQDSCNIDIIDLDLEGEYISGEFSFIAKNLETGEVKEFKSGEFQQVNLIVTDTTE
jgi:hypothetical protein